MKLQLLPAALLVLSSSVSLADPPSREALIEQIKTQYVATAIFSGDSPLVSSVLQPAMTANPGVSAETWQIVKKQTAAAVMKMLTEKGSTMDELVRSSLQSFSDQELKALNRMIGDPTYIRFQVAMTGPAAQQRIQAGVAKAVMQIRQLINGVLAEHHLKEVH